MSLFSCFYYDIRGKKRSLFFLLKRYILDINYRSVVYYRIGSHFKKRSFTRILGKLMINRLARIPGVEIRTIHKVGKGFSVQHPHDIVVGHGAVIKDNVTLYNGVTLGASLDPGEDEISGRYPTIHENTVIYPGAKIIGPVEIGRNCIVGANSVVLTSFPDNSVIAGVPAKLIKTTGNKT